MNDTQRKYLIERVNQAAKTEIDQIEEKDLTEPSLNNYLVAAALDGSLQLQDNEGLRNKIRERIIKLGPRDRFVHEEDYGRRRDIPTVTLEAADIFVFPQAYIDAREEYRKRRKEKEKKVQEITARRDTIIMKIQIGSSKALDKLVEEADNLVDLSLVNTNLTLALKSSQ